MVLEISEEVNDLGEVFRFGDDSDIVDAVGVVIGEGVGDAGEGVLEPGKVFYLGLQGVDVGRERGVFVGVQVRESGVSGILQHCWRWRSIYFLIDSD